VRHASGRVLRDGDAVAHLDIRVDGLELDAPPGSVVMLHKPAGYTTSTSDHGAVVYDLLPPRFRVRSPMMAPVGRLDKDTTGLLLFTDDGTLNHRLTSPRSHVSKVYEVILAEPLHGDDLERLAGGTMQLDGDDAPLAPATITLLADRQVRVVLSEGRYHQVKRMFGAVGNRVTSLHRSGIGALTLGTLASGAWRVLLPHEIAAVASTTDAALRAP
jgi:16S rRNA pseudouridine516 synthase